MTPTAKEALDQAARLGVTVRVADDEIQVHPAALLTSAVRAQLLANRFEIMKFLQATNRPGRARRRPRTAAVETR